MYRVGLPPRVVIPIVAVFAVIFLGIMGYFLRIGFGTTGSAFGPQAQVHEQGDARIAATPVPDAAPTDPPGTLDIPQSGTGQVAGNAPVSGEAPAAGTQAASGPDALPPGNPTGGGGPPAPVMQLLNDLKARAAKNPRDIAALVELGNLYFDASKFDGAVGYYKRALALDPDNPDTRTDYATALHGENHDLESLAQLQLVLARRPQFPEALFNEGIVANAIGRRTQAVSAFKAFLRVSPHDQRADDARTALQTLGAS